ncbi:MAG: hypothetical protein RIM68_13240 [Arenibacter sp.]
MIAAWCDYSDKGLDKNGQSLEIIDAMSGELKQVAQQTKTDPLAFIKQESLFGDLAKNKQFTELYVDMVKKIYEKGDIKKQMLSML